MPSAPKLLNDMRATIDAGDIETSNRCRDEINQLDADYRSCRTGLARIWPRWKTATAVTNCLMIPRPDQRCPADGHDQQLRRPDRPYRPQRDERVPQAFMNCVCRGTEIPADLRVSVAPMLNVRYHDHHRRERGHSHHHDHPRSSAR